MIEQLIKISNSHVRNLYWLLFSPLIKVDKSYENQALLFPDDLKNEWEFLHQDWFLNLDQSNELSQFLTKQNPTSRLGFYAERLLFFFFHNSPYIDLIWHNKQIVENGITLSEIDFVIDYQSRKIHIELAVKYYLQDKNGDWIGPNAKDTFQSKWIKVSSLQIPTARRVLQAEFPQETIESYFFVKGFLFSEDTNSDYRWVHQNEMHKVFQSGYRFSLLHKPNWMADFISYRGETINELASLRKIQALTKKAIVILSLSKYSQVTYFIVSNDWPNLDNHS